MSETYFFFWKAFWRTRLLSCSFFLQSNFFNLLVLWQVALCFPPGKWIINDWGSASSITYFIRYCSVYSLYLIEYFTCLTTLILVDTVKYEIWKKLYALFHIEQACNELTTRRTTLFRSLSIYSGYLIRGSTTTRIHLHLIWSWAENLPISVSPPHECDSVCCLTPVLLSRFSWAHLADLPCTVGYYCAVQSGESNKSLRLSY